MHDIYNFVSGPLVWISFIIFIGGSLYRFISMAILAKKKDQVVYTYMNLKYALRSIMHWSIPFAALNMRKHPVMTVFTFLFHIGLIFVPLFLFAHIILIKEAWGIGWWSIPDGAADFMTVIVIISCIFFIIRRSVLPEVKFLTSISDYIIISIAVAPFITGFWVYHQWAGSSVISILHIIAGEIMLMAIPFTRLAHMIFAPFIRGYMGSEFGAIRHAKDW